MQFLNTLYIDFGTDRYTTKKININKNYITLLDDLGIILTYII